MCGIMSLLMLVFCFSNKMMDDPCSENISDILHYKDPSKTCTAYKKDSHKFGQSNCNHKYMYMHALRPKPYS